jgi:hypothetical protein
MTAGDYALAASSRIWLAPLASLHARVEGDIRHSLVSCILSISGFDSGTRYSLTLGTLLVTSELPLLKDICQHAFPSKVAWWSMGGIECDDVKLISRYDGGGDGVPEQ